MTSKVGPKGQVVIPKALRDRLGLRPGDEVAFSMGEGGVLVEPVRDHPDLKGSLRGAGILDALETEHETEVAHGR